MNQEGNVCYRCKNVEDIYEYQKKKNTFQSNRALKNVLQFETLMWYVTLTRQKIYRHFIIFVQIEY